MRGTTPGPRSARKPKCWCGRYLGQCPHPMPNTQKSHPQHHGAPMRTLLALSLVLLSACAETPDRPSFDGEPKGIPKPARAHCRTEAEKLAQQEALDVPEDVRFCLDLRLRLDCAASMLQRAEQLEKSGRRAAAFFIRYPGAWDRDVLEDEVERLEDEASMCQTGKAAAAALALFHGIRNRAGGRIPWPDRGWSSPGLNRCGDCR